MRDTREATMLFWCGRLKRWIHPDDWVLTRTREELIDPLAAREATSGSSSTFAGGVNTRAVRKAAAYEEAVKRRRLREAVQSGK